MIGLDALLADPARIAEVPAAEVPALLVRLAAVQAALATRLVATPGPAEPAEPVALVTATEGQRLTGLSRTAFHRAAVRHGWRVDGLRTDRCYREAAIRATIARCQDASA